MVEPIQSATAATFHAGPDFLLISLGFLLVPVNGVCLVVVISYENASLAVSRDAVAPTIGEPNGFRHTDCQFLEIFERWWGRRA